MTDDNRPTENRTPRPAESLLEQLAESSLDNAYYEVDRETEPSVVMQAITLVSIVMLGFFLAVVAVQSQNNRPATEAERQALVDSIEERQATLDSRRLAAASLQAEIDTLESNVIAPSKSAQRDVLNAGAQAVVGDGVEIRLSSAAGEKAGGLVTDLDVQLVVNGLWMSGAEAVDVGGNRLSSTSAIRSAGDGITVNFQSIAEPIVVRAIGSPNSLAEQFRLSPSGRYLDARSENSGIVWSVKEADEISMSAAPNKRLEIRHASAIRRGGS